MYRKICYRASGRVDGMKSFFIKKYCRYILIMTVIFTLSFVFAGKVMIEERGREIFTGEKYKTVMVENGKGSINITDGERKKAIDKDIFLKLKKLGGLKKYTPLHTFFYAIQNIKTS